jgi:DNA-directed RNA polymerase I, II, and III subunit RPABC2
MNSTLLKNTNANKSINPKKTDDYEYEEGEVDTHSDDEDDEDDDDDNEVINDDDNDVIPEDEEPDEDDDDEYRFDHINNEDPLELPDVNPEQLAYNDDYMNDDDSDDDEDYLQKFDENVQDNIIANFHPELQSHNYDEIRNMSVVVRDIDGTIIDPLHRTLPFITRYEKAKILGERAKQINSGAKVFVEVEKHVIDGYLIALKEFDAKQIPYVIKRPMPNGGCEYWKFEDLEILI